MIGFPSTWRVARVEDLAEVQGGIQKQQRRRPVHNKHPFLRVANVERGRLNLEEIHEVELFDGEFTRLALQVGDLLVVEGNGSPDEVGRAAMWRGEIENCVHQNHLIRLRPSDSLLPRFLEFLWNSPVVRRQLRQVANSTSGLYTLSTGKINKLVLPVPPLREQHRIIGTLDKVDELRAKRREAMALFDHFAQSIFLDIFGDPTRNPKGWPRTPLRNVLVAIESGWSPQCEDRAIRDDEWGVLKLGAVTSGEYRPTESKALPLGISPREKLEVRAGDLLFSRKNTRDLVAASTLVHETPPRLLMPDLIFRLNVRADASVTKPYLHALLSYPSNRRRVQALATGSAASMPNISKARLLGFEIELPPLVLQERFAERLSPMRRLRKVNLRNLAELDALFASVQDRAFRGELFADGSPVPALSSH